MAEYKPSFPFTCPFYLLIPKYKIEKGVRVKYFEPRETIYFGSFKTYGGTDMNVNDVLVVEDTGTIETWFDPLITSECAIEIASNNRRYEILGSPENINMRNQFLKFKVRSIKGGV